MGKTITHNRSGNNPERRGFHIDVTSNYALEKMGFDDPDLARRVMTSIKKGKKVIWGFQADKVKDVIEPSEEVKAAETRYSAEMEEAARHGEIDGWPLNPHRYRPDGTVIDGGPEEGIYKGVDCRGMIPGGMVEVVSVPETPPDRLNIP